MVQLAMSSNSCGNSKLSRGSAYAVARLSRFAQLCRGYFNSAPDPNGS